MDENIRTKFFSCIYCLYPRITYNPSENPNELTTKCFLNHENKYNVNDYVSLKTEQIDVLSKLKCDKCESRKNMTYCSDEKTFLCQKCFPKNHKDKTHKLYELNKIDNCPTHKKDFLYCKKCDIVYCKICSNEAHLNHEFCPMKNFFIREEDEQKVLCTIIKLNQMNNDLLSKIFNTSTNEQIYKDTIYQYRQAEISLYTLIKNEYNSVNKSKNYNVLFNIRNHILNKYESIKNLSYIDFIKETKIPQEKNESKELLIKFLVDKNYINFDSSSYLDESNIITLKDKSQDLYIDHFLLLKNGVFITSGSNCYIYNESMELKSQFKLGESNNNNLIVSYIHYQKYNSDINTEVIYAFITGVIYEIILSKEKNDEYVYNILEHRNKRISHKVDGVIDMKNGDVIICCHMYPVICWRKDENKKFIEYSVLTEEKPYIKNAINIIHLSDNEFVTTSNSWPSLKFYEFKEDAKEKNGEYKVIKDIKMICSTRKNTLALWNNDTIIVGLDRDGICLVSAKYKEIIATVKGIDASYIYVRKNNDIIINEMMENYFLATVMKLYKFEKGEFIFKGVLKNKLQIRAKQIMENDQGNLFISEFGNETKKYSYIYKDTTNI